MAYTGNDMTRMGYLIAGVLAGCDTSEGTSKGQDTAGDDTTPACTEGFEVGECPRDFSLINHTGELVTLSELVGQPVVVLGSAEW